MAVIFCNYCINTPSKRFEYLQNNFFEHFIPFLLLSEPIFGWKVAFVFSSKSTH